VTTGGAAVGGSSHQPNFASQSQRLLSNRILRCIEKIVLTGGTLDLEALCLIPGLWVWRFQLALIVLDDGGNIMDASVMAAIASLRHYRRPQVDLGGADGKSNSGSSGNNNTDESIVTTVPMLIPSHLKEPTPLPLHHTPLSVSFAFVPMEDGSSLSTAASVVSDGINRSSSSGVVAALVDPTDREELLQNGSLTVGMNAYAEVCLLDYGGGCELPPTQLEECWKKAISCVRQLCTMLETSLEDADKQAQTDRLEKLKQQQLAPSFATTNTSSQISSPFFEQSENPGGDNMMDIDDNNDEIKRMETEAEEAYRQQALDYSQGYKANKVREDDDHMRNSSQPFFNQASNLMKTLLASAASPAPSSSRGNDAVQKSANAKQSKKETKEAAEKTEKQGKKPIKYNASVNLESDEEEAIEMLQSEFDTVSAPPNAQSKIEPEKGAVEDGSDSDIDDLAMAVTKKKKKKKKDKK